MLLIGSQTNIVSHDKGNGIRRDGSIGLTLGMHRGHYTTREMVIDNTATNGARWKDAPLLYRNGAPRESAPLVSYHLMAHGLKSAPLRIVSWTSPSPQT